MIWLGSISVATLLALSGCSTATVSTLAPSGSATSSTQPAANGSGDPCVVIPVATLEKITGLTPLTVPAATAGKSKNGCRWPGPDGKTGVAYDVLPVRGGWQDMLAAMQQKQTGTTNADFGHGNTGFVAGASQTEFKLAVGTAVVVFPPNRYAIITTTLPDGSDASGVALALGKAFSDAADQLPAAPTK